MFKIPPRLQASRWRYVLGGLLVILGTITLVLPVGPGLFLIFSGLYMINSDWANKKLTRIKSIVNRWKEKFKRK